MSESRKPIISIDDVSKSDEISVKQVYAYFLKSWGYDIKLSIKEIAQPSNFVHSKSSTPPSPDLIDISTIHPSESTRLHYFRIRDKLTYLNSTNDNSSQETAVDSVNNNLNELSLSKKTTNDSHKSHSHSHYHHKLRTDKLVTHGHLQQFNPDELQECFIKLSKNDCPDTNILRFTVARKFEPNDSLSMAAKCLSWRLNSHPIDDWVLAGDAEPYWNKSHPKFIEAFKLNQVYIRGVDKLKRPIVIIHVQKHLRKNCPDHDFERFICCMIEYIRLQLTPLTNGVNQGCILFDMTGFSMKNADLAAVHFLAIMFEANYPECLGLIWIHNAPWIFNAVWKIIKGWLDPVVASKIKFTKGVKDLKQDIDLKYIPKSLDGEDTFKNEYITPTIENSDKLPKDEKFDSLTNERNEIYCCFLQSTIDWLHAKTIEESAKLLEIRKIIQTDLCKNYIALDPYIRTRSPFERNGEMHPIGI